MTNISSTSSSSPLLNRIAELTFGSMDADKSGGISKKEFKDVFARTAVGRTGRDGEQLFARLDQNRDGELSPQEVKDGIRTLLASLQRPRTEWNPMEAFEKLETSVSV